MARSQRTAPVGVNEASYGSEEGEIDAVDAWEAQLNIDDGIEQLAPDDSAPAKAKEAKAAPDEDDDLPDVNWDDEDPDAEGEEADEEGEEDQEGEEGEEGEEGDEDDDDDTSDYLADEDLERKVSFKDKSTGEEIATTVKELRDGYFRTQDYTKKTQALAEERRAAQQEADKQQQEWAGYLNQMEVTLNTLIGGRTEQEWAELERKDRYTYLEEKDKHHALLTRREAVKAEQERVQREQQEKSQEQFKAYVTAEKEQLFAALPEWKENPETANRDWHRMVDYGKTLGYTEQDLKSVVDHRMVVILRDAARLHALEAKRQRSPGTSSSKVRKSNKGQLPAGTPKNRGTKTAKLRESSKNLAKKQNVSATADYFENLISDS